MKWKLKTSNAKTKTKSVYIKHTSIKRQVSRKVGGPDIVVLYLSHNDVLLEH